MVRPKLGYPTKLELQILKVLWQRSPLPVRDVRQALAAAGKELAHTSVITTLNTMAHKKYLHRSMQGNASMFAPRISRKDVRWGMLSDMVNRVYDGSAKEVVLGLFDCGELNASDLKELQTLINQKAKEQSDDRK
jgi:predicted transcriptional regulator